jgi:hypothetical protein
LSKVFEGGFGGFLSVKDGDAVIHPWIELYTAVTAYTSFKHNTGGQRHFRALPLSI